MQIKATMRYHLTVSRMAIIKKSTNNAGMGVERREPFSTFGEDVNWYSHRCCAAKSLQSCLTLCNPIDGSPLGSSVPGILQARILEWVAIAFSRYSH